ncbi:hypothetical protein [Halopseudomonas bauzanensis]
MSGTSLDGIDIALTSFSPSAPRATLLGATCMPFPPRITSRSARTLPTRSG